MKVLLTNLYFDKFGGSQLVTLEIAEELQERGHEVLIYSPCVAEPMRSACHVPLVNIRPDYRSFDIVWSHHALAEDYIPRTSQRIIFNHMSSWMHLEFPRDANRESQIAWKVLANSPETAARMRLLGIKCNIELFQNPAPKQFGMFMRKPQYILLVSNHRPREVVDMAHKLDLPLRFIGEGAGEEFTRVTPDILAGAHFVICNGKTVQYALRMGVPVFLYDNLGGPGWLTESNFEAAEWHNFSGRCTRGRDVSGLMNWRHYAPIDCPERFKLERRLEALEL